MSFLLNIRKEISFFFFNFRSAFIVLICFLLNIRKEMCYFCCNFFSIFIVLISVFAKYQKENVYIFFFVLISLLFLSF